MNPLISIIIASYNRASLIGGTLDSILAQTHTNWECIIIDDGSTDNTVEVIESYLEKDHRFRFCLRSNNKPKGANACRNQGLKMSNGTYIMFFDSDDIMYPNKLEIQLEDIKKGDFDFSVTQTELFDIKKDIRLGLRSETLESEYIIDDFINFKCFWLLQSVLWKKRFLVENNLSLNESLQQAQDYEFHLNVLKTTYAYCANNAITTKMLIHGSNMSISQIDTPAKIYSNAFVQQKIITELNTDISEETLQKSFDKLVAFYREAIRKRQIKNAFSIAKMLNNCLSFFGSSRLKKIDIAKGLVYPVFGIGYKWTKIF